MAGSPPTRLIPHPCAPPGQAAKPMHVDDEASAAGRAPADASSEGTPLPAAELVDEEEEEEEPPAAAVVEEPPAAAVEQQQQLARLSPSLSLLHVSFSSACVCVCVRSIDRGWDTPAEHTHHTRRQADVVREKFWWTTADAHVPEEIDYNERQKVFPFKNPDDFLADEHQSLPLEIRVLLVLLKARKTQNYMVTRLKTDPGFPELMSEDTELDSAVTSAAVLLKEVWKHGPAVSVAIPYATGPTHFIMTQLGLLQKTDESTTANSEKPRQSVFNDRSRLRALFSELRQLPASGFEAHTGPWFIERSLAIGGVLKRTLALTGQYKAFRATRALLGDVQRKTWGSTTLAQLADVSPDRCGAFDKLYAQLRELGVDDPGALPVARLEEALPVAVGAQAFTMWECLLNDILPELDEEEKEDDEKGWEHSREHELPPDEQIIDNEKPIEPIDHIVGVKLMPRGNGRERDCWVCFRADKRIKKMNSSEIQNKFNKTWLDGVREKPNRTHRVVAGRSSAATGSENSFVDGGYIPTNFMLPIPFTQKGASNCAYASAANGLAAVGAVDRDGAPIAADVFSLQGVTPTSKRDQSLKTMRPELFIKSYVAKRHWQCMDVKTRDRANTPLLRRDNFPWEFVRRTSEAPCTWPVVLRFTDTTGRDNHFVAAYGGLLWDGNQHSTMPFTLASLDEAAPENARFVAVAYAYELVPSRRAMKKMKQPAAQPMHVDTSTRKTGVKRERTRKTQGMRKKKKKTTPPAAAVVEEEPPAAAVVEEEPPAAVVEEEPPAAVVEEEPPAAVVEEEPPAAAVEEPPAAAAVVEEPPAAAAVVEEPPAAAAAVEEPPAAAVEEPPAADAGPSAVPITGRVDGGSVLYDGVFYPVKYVQHVLTTGKYAVRWADGSNSRIPEDDFVYRH